MSEASLPQLSGRLLSALRDRPPDNTELPPPAMLEAPERILQFGSGNFLRGFIEDFVQASNSAGHFSGRVVSVQRKRDYRFEASRKQDGLYTLVLRGAQGGRASELKRIIASVSRNLSAEEEWKEITSVAVNPSTRVIVTNVTEAGLAPEVSDRPWSVPRGFPGKLVRLLWERWKSARGRDADIAIVPCELVESNGSVVRDLLLKQAATWKLEYAFLDWIRNSVHYANTLVDRIVVGTPAQNALEAEWRTLGYKDELLNCCEPFYLFVVEADEFIRQHFCLDGASPNVRFVEDLTPYRLQKLRILNGPHTVLAAVGRLLGLQTVREAVAHPHLGPFIEELILTEIVPTLAVPHEASRLYATEVLERFRNPFVEHQLLAICLNCSTKVGVRLYPSLREYVAQKETIPQGLTLGLAAVTMVLLDPEVNDTHAEHVRERWAQVIPGSHESLTRFARDVLESYAAWSNEEIPPDAIAVRLGDLLGSLSQRGARSLLEEWSRAGRT
jgi:tagaturonate reductase